ncbi:MULTISPECIES: hypothetical protein [Comamonas]|uniref:hypothetical protein n=1 Tax=Comamonas TaxID=283 RepID=UPI00211475F8|nr:MULTISPECIES: hypothetical protein [Comamonas]UUE95020.1 hypothetical protein MJ608_05015 [Comamonas thiooxydans]
MTIDNVMDLVLMRRKSILGQRSRVAHQFMRIHRYMLENSSEEDSADADGVDALEDKPSKA